MQKFIKISGAWAGKAKAAAARFLRDNEGVSTVEYALIVVAVIAILGVAAGTIGGAFDTLFNNFENQMNAAIANVQNNV